MIYKIGTVNEMEIVKKVLPAGLYQAVLDIVTALDTNYGEERDVDEKDGGFVLVLQTFQDISEVSDCDIQIDNGTHEYVNLVKCGDTEYINVLYLMNNEFGINVLVCFKIA